MKKLLISAGAIAALALSSAPAQAATPTNGQATATARIYTPLTLVMDRSLDFGTIVKSGTGAYTDTIVMDLTGGISGCANVVCAASGQTAQYTATGTQGATVAVTVSPTIAMSNLTTTTAPDLTLTVNAPASVTLDATGNNTFDLAGSIQVSDTTAEGLYEGTFDVSADYQ